MNEVFLMLGSNLGDRLNHLDLATNLIEEKFGKCFRKSSIYETEPFGIREQPYFLNQLISFLTVINPSEILETIMDIEMKLGRKRTMKWAERIIDIDILFYGNIVLNLPDLIIPHKGIELRKFCLVPLNELITDFINPKGNKAINELLINCEDDLTVNISL
jgi:2-amino-4-hydroxy-6-hydroxymethyldihydropteridine diphosphokinase